MSTTRRRTVRLLSTCAALGLATTLLAPGAHAAPGIDTADPDTAAPDAANMDDGDADVLRDAAQSTGSVIVVAHGDASTTYASGTTRAGADDLPTGEDQFRVASNTKMYVATVLLQLVDEGALDLDAPIGEYLPGLVTGDGIDESRITVRQLMQHTSGVADNLTPDVIFDPRLQWFPPTPEEMVALGLRHGSQSEPGTTWSYSSTGYLHGVPLNDPLYRAAAYRTSNRTINELGRIPAAYRDYVDEVARHLEAFAVPR